MKTVISRKSIRKFAERPVDSTLLNTLLDASARTQTMGNLQLYFEAGIWVWRSTDL